MENGKWKMGKWKMEIRNQKMLILFMFTESKTKHQKEKKFEAKK